MKFCAGFTCLRPFPRVTWPCLVIALACLFPTCDAQAGDSLYAVFANNGVTLGSANIQGGAVGANNGIVSIAPSSTFTRGVAGGGSLTYTSTGGSDTFNGPITFNGSVNLGSFNTFWAPIDAGGDISFASSAVLHADVTAGGSISSSFATATANLRASNDVNLTSSFDTVTGNVFAGRNATVKGTVNGNVTYGNTLTTGAFTQINGSAIHAPSTANPKPFVPELMPAADTFTAGGVNLTTGGSLAAPLAPGSYNSISVPVFTEVYLTAGDYYFNTVDLTNAWVIHLLNLTGSNGIRVFVNGDMKLASAFGTKVNEQDFASSNPLLGANVLWETLGNADINTGSLIGTVFAPNGNIGLGSAQSLNGSLIAGGTITSGSNLNLNYVTPAQPAYAVPEPSSLAMLALAVTALLGRRRRV